MTLRTLASLATPLLLAACVRHDESLVPGTIERDRVELVADATEFIVALPFSEGATVKAGDVIVVQNRSPVPVGTIVVTPVQVNAGGQIVAQGKQVSIRGPLASGAQIAADGGLTSLTAEQLAAVRVRVDSARVAE